MNRSKRLGHLPLRRLSGPGEFAVLYDVAKQERCHLSKFMKRFAEV